MCKSLLYSIFYFFDPIVNILEVLPKDKKAKEEKTAVFGQASLDLLPTLLGEAHTSPLTLTLHTVTEVGGAPSTKSSEAVSIMKSIPNALWYL